LLPELQNTDRGARSTGLKLTLVAMSALSVRAPAASVLEAGAVGNKVPSKTEGFTKSYQQPVGLVGIAGSARVKYV